MATQAAPLLEEMPSRRTIWRIVLTAVAATILVMALGAGAFLVYHDKTTEISDLTAQREGLEATSVNLRGQLTRAEKRLRTSNAKLRTNSVRLARAKRNLTKIRKDLAAANQRAEANYSAGYNAGNSTGFDSGYSSGRDAGLVQGSDDLACSDDPDVTWLPACNY
jgi:hypothetical protein